MQSGGGGDGGRRRPTIPSVDRGKKKKYKKQSLDPELQVYRDPNLLAYERWENVQEPWKLKDAMTYVGFTHIDRWFDEAEHLKNCDAKSIHYPHIRDITVKWRCLEILRIVSNLAKYPKNKVPKSIAAMIYVELVLRKRVDWSTLHSSTPGNVGGLGEWLAKRTPQATVPITPVPQWFRVKPELVDEPNKPLPPNREDYKPRSRKSTTRKEKATTTVDLDNDSDDDDGDEGEPTAVLSDPRLGVGAATEDNLSTQFGALQSGERSEATYVAEIAKLQEDMTKLKCENQDLMLTTMLAIARSMQFESELKSIADEWTQGRRLRALMLTSWPLEETMYPTAWEDIMPSIYKDNGSIDWTRVPVEDENWNVDETNDGIKVWSHLHTNTSDGSKCTSCQNPMGPEGWYTLGTCGHSYHPQCLIKTMIQSRICTICKRPFHPRLYMEFGIKEFMPTHWVYREEDYEEGAVATVIGQPVEWSWKLNASKARILWENEKAGTLQHPDNLMVAADRMYPHTPPYNGKKMFFYQCMGWTFNRASNKLERFIGAGDLFDSSGKEVIDEEERDSMHQHRLEHMYPLMREALEAILEDYSSDINAWIQRRQILENRGNGGASSSGI